MSARAWTVGAAGLGALTLACAGMQLPVLPQSPEQIAQLGGTALKSGVNFSKCSELREKVSVQEESALGGAVALKWVSGGGGLLLEKPATEDGLPSGRKADLQTYVNTVGRNLAAQSARPTLRWTFGVLSDAKAFNATSAPGGYVFVTRGLLAAVENEAQLAGVLAHEIAHITEHHALKQYDEVKVSQCRTAASFEGLNEGVSQMGGKLTPDMVDVFVRAMEGSGALDLDSNSGLLGLLTNQMVEKLVSEGFAEKHEHAADAEAVRLLVSAGYDPTEYIRFLGKLPKGENNFAHHPSTAERQRALRDQLKSAASAPDEFPDFPADSAGLKKPELPPAVAVVKERN
jgi:hypothetical protein